MLQEDVVGRAPHCCVFFFSSRRRHTRFKCDWSSDVCSSDLIGYPFFIWNEKTRKVWLICICGMHFAIGVTMGMYLFALIMIILNIAAFGQGLIGDSAKQLFVRRQTAHA